MNIEVKFDKWSYQHKALFLTKNAQTVEKFCQDFIRSRFSRGYRLRVIPDYSDNTLEIQSHCAEMFKPMLRAIYEHFSKDFCKRVKPQNRWQIMANQMGRSWKE